jgi:signal transduction histidine kinase
VVPSGEFKPHGTALGFPVRRGYKYKMPSSILKLLKWLNPKQPKRPPSYFKLVFVWDPLVTFIFVTAFGGFHDFWSRAALGLAIAVTVSNTIFALVWSLLWIEARYFKARGLAVPPANPNRVRIICVLGMLPGVYLGFVIAGAIAARFHWAWDTPGLSDYSTGMTYGLLFFVIFILVDLWSAATSAKQAADLQLKQLENERLQARLSALTAQMNPHLLFNALNTIASMIPSDPEKAEDVTVRLSELYRGVLDSSRKSIHSLDQELKICRAYFAIERSRFGERLAAEIEIQPALAPETVHIPALLLQPLVENAIKHGIAPRSSGGKVRLSARLENSKLVMTVEDDGLGYGNSTSTAGAKSGLANCRSRIELMYGDQGKFEIAPRAGGGTVVRISLPTEKIGSPL